MVNVGYLYVVDGEQRGSYLELSDAGTYKMASKYGADIFVKLINIHDFICEFAISDDGVAFNNYNYPFDVSGALVKSGFNYPLPLLCEIDGTRYLFSKDADIDIDRAVGELDLLVNKNLDGAEILLDQIEYADNIESVAKAKPKILKGKLLKLIMVKRMIEIGKQIWVKLNEMTKILYDRMGSWIYLLVVVCMILLFGIGFTIYQLRSDSIITAKQEQQLELKSKVQKVFLKLTSSYSNLKLITTDDNKYIIRGVLWDDNDIDYVERMFSPWKDVVKVRISTFAEIMPKILKIMNQYSVQLAGINFNRDLGSIELSGIIDDINKLDDLGVALNNQLPNLGEIDTTHIYMLANIENDLDNLVKIGIKSRILVDRDYKKGQINISGYLTENEAKELEKATDSFNQKYGKVVLIKLNIQNLVTALPFKIVSVFIGNPSWILTDGGVRLFIGGSYRGITVIDINSNRVVLRGQFPLIINLNELLSPQYTDEDTDTNSNVPSLLKKESNMVGESE